MTRESFPSDEASEMIGKVEVENVYALGWVGTHHTLAVDVSIFEVNTEQGGGAELTSANYVECAAARSGYSKGPTNPM